MRGQLNPAPLSANNFTLLRCTGHTGPAAGHRRGVSQDGRRAGGEQQERYQDDSDERFLHILKLLQEVVWGNSPIRA